jgi:prephenate dehydrogenase
MNTSIPVRKVAVIGAGGKMGRWFTYYFARSQNVRVSVYDKKRLAFRNLKGVDRYQTIGACVKEADLVIVCVPIDTIVSVVQECFTYMKEGAALSEISSIKKQIFKVLRAARNDITCLCIHPMFGPATKSSRIIKTLLIPVKNRARELAILKSIFPRSEIEVVRNPDLHDEYMAVVIGLTYYLNLVLGSMLSKLDLGTMKKVAGTSFGMQIMITESVLNDSSEFVSSLLRENAFNQKYFANFLAEAEKLQNLVAGKKERAIARAVEDIKIRINRFTDTDKSYIKFYRAIEYLEDIRHQEMKLKVKLKPKPR